MATVPCIIYMHQCPMRAAEKGANDIEQRQWQSVCQPTKPYIQQMKYCSAWSSPCLKQKEKAALSIAMLLLLP
eukprot:scaffold213354_cov39-Prasinocladus_malaysianus.AAC.2